MTARTDGKPWILEHIGVTISFVTLLGLAIKVTSVAHGHYETIGTLMGTVALPTVLLTAVLVALPTAALFGMFAASTWFMEAIREEDPLREQATTAAVATVTAAALVPMKMFLVMLIVELWLVVTSVVIRVYRAWFRRRLPLATSHPLSLLSFDPTRHNIRLSLALFVLIMIGTATVSDRPWLPPEAIRTRSNDIPRTVFVLDESGLFTRLLIDRTRSVELVRTSDITDRVACARPASDRSLLARVIWSKTPQFPKCPGSSH